jgi:alpha-beta hydrolase superfamily lysophospholipase
MAFAHGTSGVSQECAPSSNSALMGNAEIVGDLLRAGFAVAATDYQGLGAPGGHPYLDAKTAGYNVIDSVRALRFVSPDVSTTWAAYGGSQGGGAAWAANEMANTYAPDMKPIGSVNVVPAADMSGYAALAAEGTLSKDQRAAYIWILMGLEQTRPGFPIDDYRRGLAKEKWDALAACSPAKVQERAQVLALMSPEDLKPVSPEAQQRLYDVLKSMALPLQRAAAPMLVVYSGQDTYIDPEWTKNAIDRACELGDQIYAIYEPNQGHSNVDAGELPEEWLGERFGGDPPLDTCKH